MLKNPSPHKKNQQVGNGEDIYTLNPVAASEKISLGAAQPIWVRLPKSGQQCPYTGLSRSVLNGLILGTNAPVRSLSLRKQFALKGTRLIHLGSLLAYLEAMATSQNNQNNTEEDHYA